MRDPFFQVDVGLEPVLGFAVVIISTHERDCAVGGCATVLACVGLG